MFMYICTCQCQCTVCIVSAGAGADSDAHTRHMPDVRTVRAHLHASGVSRFQHARARKVRTRSPRPSAIISPVRPPTPTQRLSNAHPPPIHRPFTAHSPPHTVMDYYLIYVRVFDASTLC